MENSVIFIFETERSLEITVYGPCIEPSIIITYQLIFNAWMPSRSATLTDEDARY